MFSSLCAVPDRRAPDEPDVESRWYDQLRRDGGLAVSLEDGRIEFIPNRIVDRKLLDVRFTRYDDKNKTIGVYMAKEAELSLSANNRLLLVSVEYLQVTDHQGNPLLPLSERMTTFYLELPRAR
jgi:hypothetical protein